MASRRPWFKFYYDRFFGAVAALGLSDEEAMAYLRLLTSQFVNGRVPDDPARIARILGRPLEEARAMWDILSGKFPDGENSFMAEVRAESIRDHERKSAGGRKTAERNRQLAAERNAKQGAEHPTEQGAMRDARCDIRDTRRENREERALAREGAPAPAADAAPPPPGKKKSRKAQTAELEAGWDAALESILAEIPGFRDYAGFLGPWNRWRAYKLGSKHKSPPSDKNARRLARLLEDSLSGPDQFDAFIDGAIEREWRALCDGSYSRLYVQQAQTNGRAR